MIYGIYIHAWNISTRGRLDKMCNIYVHKRQNDKKNLAVSILSAGGLADQGISVSVGIMST